MNPNGIDDLCVCVLGLTKCTCRTQSPPLAPLADDERRFLELHKIGGGSEYITEWREMFGGGTIKAKTNKGRVAALSRARVDALIADGLMGTGWGGSFHVTEKGRAV